REAFQQLSRGRLVPEVQLQVQSECVMCGSGVPAGAAQCPACGEALTWCQGSGCGQSFPASAGFCPACGLPNGAAASGETGDAAFSADSSNTNSNALAVEAVTAPRSPASTSPQSS